MKVYVVFYNNPYGATGVDKVFYSREKAEDYINTSVPSILKQYWQIREREVN